MKRIFKILLQIVILPLSFCFSQAGRAFTLKDVMQFKQIKQSAISAYGNFVAFEARPDRGNSQAIIKSTVNDAEYKFERGHKINFSGDEKWISIFLKKEYADLEKSKGKSDEGLILFNISTNDTSEYKNVSEIKFAENSGWAAIHFSKGFSEDSIGKKGKEHLGKPLILRNLNSSKEDTLDFVTEFEFDSLSTHLAVAVCDTNILMNGLYFYNLAEKNYTQIDTSSNISIGNLTWHNNKLAYTKSMFNKDNKTDSGDVFIWNKKPLLIASSDMSEIGWYIPSENKLEWSKDGKLIYFGYKKVLSTKTADQNDSTDSDIFDFENILKGKTLDVWHWNDPLIKTNEKKEWNKKKKFIYTAVYNFNDKRITRLADEKMREIIYNDNNDYAIGKDETPYTKLRTWDGDYDDYYVVNISNGERIKVADKISGTVSLSPKGGYVVYYEKSDWHLYNIKTKQTINLTEKINVPFENEDHDYPSDAPGYGIAGWLSDDSAVLIYDKYDIWKFKSNSSEPVCITDTFGRKNELTFRIKNLSPGKKVIEKNDTLFLTSFNNKEKYTALYSLELSSNKLELLIKENKKLEPLAKAKNNNSILYSRETYDEFPDLWITSDNFKSTKKLTDYDKQREPYAWGSAELIEWNSIDGIPLQGVVIKPGNYEPGKKYPVLVYYYRFFSQRVHEFNDMVVNHRPNFPYYASNGYIVFLPDIRFDIGRPGYSATKCLVPGVQKLIDIGIADPKAIALHGHSWSGYQTAFVITQTNIFACAIAGAPVSNMTSAYSGIRWGTGLARQFQYEKTQSRIGGSLWEYPERYIENSPVFYADKINTPLLIQFGDEDDAVPWYQGIELYLAMRRLEKDCIFLQYNGEPHHLKKYPNKLDYSIKMKEYLDHYCKGMPAAEWITSGREFIGE